MSSGLVLLGGLLQIAGIAVAAWGLNDLSKAILGEQPTPVGHVVRFLRHLIPHRRRDRRQGPPRPTSAL